MSWPSSFAVRKLIWIIQRALYSFGSFNEFCLRLNWQVCSKCDITYFTGVSSVYVSFLTMRRLNEIFSFVLESVMKNKDAALRFSSSTFAIAFLMHEFFTADIRKFLWADFRSFSTTAAYISRSTRSVPGCSPICQDFSSFAALVCAFLRLLILFWHPTLYCGLLLLYVWQHARRIKIPLVGFDVCISSLILTVIWNW